MSETEIADERLRRWRLILGGGNADGIQIRLGKEDSGLDKVLEALYDSERQGGLGSSAPNVARWLGDIRSYFPASVVKIMQKDAIERLELQEILMQPEILELVEPDIHLVSVLISLGRVMPDHVKQTARQVVRRVVEELERKLANPLRQAVTGSLNRVARNRRPRHQEINWNLTIRANLKHYQRDYRTIIPETRIGFGRKGASLRDIILCVDQSGSMANSVVYSSVFAAVLASIRAVRTSLVVFDTEVVDLTELLSDPVEVLFGVQLGGGTDINRALTYCQSLVSEPQNTIFVLISDLYEGGDVKEMFRRAAALVNSGVQVITLLALDDSGTPGFNASNASMLAEMGIPCFGCTPDLFPDLMAVAIKKQDVSLWAATQGIATIKSSL